MFPQIIDRDLYQSQNDKEKRESQKLGGHLWITGRTAEDSLKATEKALGREWFAITAFPLFVGTFGPIASALNICALVRPWRYELGPKDIGIGDDIADPTWLITTNALSLVFGVVANASILLVAGDGDGWRANYDLQLIIGTIIGGIVASTILIALVVTASVQFNRPSSPSFSFTEAFYYAIISGVLYIITSSFIIYTAHRLWHLSKEERAEIQIAKGHRRLMRLTVIFMAYILLGAAVFFHVEGWRYLDAVYWADVTILTIGFGDFKPLTTLGRALLIPYATGGIFILFLVIYCVPKLVFERGGSMWEIHLRDQERIKSVRKREKEEPVKNAACHDRSSSRNAAEERNNFVNCEDIGQTPRALGSYIDEREMRRRDFILMQDILRRSTRKRFLYSVILWGSSLLFLWLVGATCFFALERSQGWTYFDAVYFAFTAISVIGYDDRTLFTNSGKAFFVMWSLIVVPTLTMLIATAVEAVGHPYVAAQIPYMDARENRVGRKIIGNIPSKEDERLSSTGDNKASEQLAHNNHNNHDKNHLLVQALKQVIVDHILHKQGNESPEYSFEEWEYIFYLLGAGDNEESRAGKRMMDWLHCKNPLNTTKKLTEWLLLTLVEKLEEELLELRRKMGNTAVQ